MRYPAIPVLICLAIIAALAPTNRAEGHQPTPPIEIVVETKDADRQGLTVALILTATVNVTSVQLNVSAQEGVIVNGGRRSLDLKRGEPMRIEVKLRASRSGAHRLQFSLEAKAENYITAGGATRRYLLVDEQNQARLVTGAYLRDMRRGEALDRLEREQNKDLTLDDILTGPLGKAKVDRDVEERAAPQVIAPPPGGIEPYERDVIKDMSADVHRDLDPLTIQGRLFFVDRDGVTGVLVNAAIDIRDDDTFGDEHLTTVITGWDGRFSATVNNDDGWLQNGRDIYFRVRTSNSRFRVQDCGLVNFTYSWRSSTRNDLSDGSIVDFGDLQPTTDMDAAVMFQDLNAGWNYVTSQGAQDPGFANLCWPEGGSFYDFANINIDDGDEVAEDIVLHEYGHAIMHNAYNNNYWPSNATGPHTFCDPTPQHRNLAFTEGWANFIPLAVNPDGIYHSNGWSWGIESNTCGNANGKRDETMVAAGLLDIRDTASDGGCSDDDCDPSGANNVSFVDMWRDTVWNQNLDDVDEYWDVLCPELTEDQHNNAIQSFAFNEIDVDACQCTAELSLSAFARDDDARIAEIPRTLDSLRQFRDLVLMDTVVGRRMVDHYYAHHREANKIILGNPQTLSMSAQIFTRVANVMRSYRDGKGADRPLLDEKSAQTVRRLAAILKAEASPEFRLAIYEAEQFIGSASTVPLNRMEAILDRPSPK